LRAERSMHAGRRCAETTEVMDVRVRGRDGGVIDEASERADGDVETGDEVEGLRLWGRELCEDDWGDTPYGMVAAHARTPSGPLPIHSDALKPLEWTCDDEGEAYG